MFNNPQTGERLYSLSEVKEIVKKATSEKERSLKEEYERVLRNKLDEQFQQFSTFNEDFLSRQMASRCVFLAAFRRPLFLPCQRAPPHSSFFPVRSPPFRSSHDYMS